jgi:hypothetical protein
VFRSATFGAVAALLCCMAGRAAAVNAKDPIIIIAGDDDVTGGYPLGSSFSILSPTGSSPLHLLGGSPCVVLGIELPLCLFSNGTDFTWTTLSFSIAPGHQTGPFTCLALAYFSQCRFSDENRKVAFVGGKGIAAGDVFLFAVVSWLPNTTFSGEATGSESISGGASWRPSLPRAPAPRSQPSQAELFRDGHIASRDRSGLRVAKRAA